MPVTPERRRELKNGAPRRKTGPKGPNKHKVIRKLHRQLKEDHCADCKTRFPFYVMHFDHVRGKKITEISTLSKTTTDMDLFLAEVAKCDLVCANCHAVRTYKRGYARKPTTAKAILEERE